MWHPMPDGANAYPAYECCRIPHMWIDAAECGIACRIALNAYPAYNFPTDERLNRDIKL
ncbi:hypothetical protein [Kosakonia cowanii]|uniref:hypothetical protein n=1 Tax=Kosakonia cowanii TaxID=208223 RepID=UPI0013E298AC|nr:hypothetical protein [Kosakonia cowanii]